MSDLTKQERTAIEAVARRFEASWENGNHPPDVFLTVAGKRVAVEIATLERRGTGQGGAAKPRLRFDKVATRLMERLQATLGETVPDGMTVLVTVTAPIRLASKTAAALEDKIQGLLKRRAPGRDKPGRDEEDTIHGNAVRIRVLRHKSERAPTLIGFVHNPDSDPVLLLNMTGELLELIGARTGRQRTKLAGGRWLMMISAELASFSEVYRYLCSQLPMASEFERILAVFEDGRVEVLTG